MPGFHKRREYKYEGTVESIYLMDDMTGRSCLQTLPMFLLMSPLSHKIKAKVKTALITDALNAQQVVTKEAF